MKRTLSAFETFMWLGAQKTPCNFTVTAHLRGTIQSDALQVALQSLKAIHPLLSVRIGLDYQHHPAFFSAKSAQFSIRQVPRQDDRTWIYEVEEELRHGFIDDRGPLARFVLVQGQDRTELIVTSHHAVADGLSGVYVLRDSLRLLSDPSLKLAPFPLRPSIDELLPIPPDEDVSRFKTTTQTNTRLSLEPTADVRSTEDYQVVSVPREKHFIIDPWSLSVEQTAQLTDCCKAQGVSVHSAIATAMLLTFAEVKGNPAPYMRRFSSAVSLRGRLREPIGEEFGFYVTPQLSILVECRTEDNFWGVARQVYNTFQQEATPEHLFAPHLVMRQIVHDLTDESTPANDVDYDVAYDFAISNLGRLPIPTQYGDLILEALYAPTVNGYGDERILGVCTIGGQAFFNFVVDAEFMGREEVDKIHAGFMRHLSEALTS